MKTIRVFFLCVEEMGNLSKLPGIFGSLLFAIKRKKALLRRAFFQQKLQKKGASAQLVSNWKTRRFFDEAGPTASSARLVLNES